LHTSKGRAGGAVTVASLLALTLVLVDGEDMPDMNGANNRAVAAASCSGNCKTNIKITNRCIMRHAIPVRNGRVRLSHILHTFTLRIPRTLDLYINPAITPQMPGTSDRFHDDNKSWRNTPTCPYSTASKGMIQLTVMKESKTRT